MLPSRRSAAYVALLAFASGCSGSPEPKLTLYRVVDERGVITYVTNDPYDDAVEKDRRNAELRHESQQQADLSRVRQQNMEAEALSRQARQEQFRQEQRGIQDYQNQRRENERELSSRAQPQLRQENPQPFRNYEGESIRRQRGSQEIDNALWRMRQQQEQQLHLRQQQQR